MPRGSWHHHSIQAHDRSVLRTHAIVPRIRNPPLADASGYLLIWVSVSSVLMSVHASMPIHQATETGLYSKLSIACNLYCHIKTCSRRSFILYSPPTSIGGSLRFHHSDAHTFFSRLLSISLSVSVRPLSSLASSSSILVLALPHSSAP